MTELDPPSKNIIQPTETEYLCIYSWTVKDCLVREIVFKLVFFFFFFFVQIILGQLENRFLYT